ncbi:GNAT family N-acetyltransferase [Bacillus sp. B15-48]|uniref:GNAT family N-acetyltransferase n=1 Tax=Bacillus sp. B15-48 TaxID=1548601 RepID=UPI00193FF9D3|nr:GNAT family N-acetyltransferase [Bacillus sp. B15-48]MBM4764776.1 GNAT family N-acetyltransferase [Bacillus sp. B15-48]
MEFKLADASDAPIIHELMIKAFLEYENEEPPSSALEETVESISTALMENEKGFIAYDDEQPIGMVRFKFIQNGLYFFRLSVIPEKQGQGIAKEILKHLEIYAKNKEISTLLCKVRKTVPKNIQLYRSIGYRVFDEEILHKPNGVNIKVVSMMKQI